MEPALASRLNVLSQLKLRGGADVENCDEVVVGNNTAPTVHSVPEDSCIIIPGSYCCSYQVLRNVLVL